MGQLVNLVVGVWEQVSNGGWMFLEDPTERRYSVMVHENQTYASLMDLVRTCYSVGNQTAVALTYEFPEWMKVPGDIATPPGDVREDGDVDLFMSIRLEIPDLKLLVIIGNDVVARYLLKRRDKCTVIGSSSGGLAQKTFAYRGHNVVNHVSPAAWPDQTVGLNDGKAYWESMLAQGWVSANQQYLMDLCTDEDIELFPKNPLSQNTPSRVLAPLSSEGTHSSTDSSAAPVTSRQPIEPRGIIRLDESNQPLVSRPSLALTIVEPQQKRASILDYLTKGKGIVCEEEVGRGKRERPPGFDRAPTPNPNFPDPGPYEYSTDEDSEDEGKQHLFVGQENNNNKLRN